MMAFLYPWATKEYLLWNMTIGQIILYHNKGVELQWPGSLNSLEPGLANKGPKELRVIRDTIFKQMDKDKEEKEKLDEISRLKEVMKAKYGDI